MIEVRTGHNLELLQAMPSKSVQCCLTSPPYWGLRDYGDPGKEWPEVTFSPMPGLPPMTIPASTEPLGLEADPWAYVGHLVALFREVRRVLADDGVLFLNLGDSWHNVRTHNGGATCTNTVHRGGARDGTEGFGRPNRARRLPGLKEKDLIGIPWRAAFALQADGWYLRQRIAWVKTNPMPDKYRDRCVSASECVFLLAKSSSYSLDFRHEPKPPLDWWDIPAAQVPGHHAVWPSELAARCIKAGSRKGDTVLDPFGGSGTTGLVAREHGRSCVLLEQSPTYADMARARLGQAPADVATARDQTAALPLFGGGAQ